jgi:predicted DNA-binding transcriptional regulator YafY
MTSSILSVNADDVTIDYTNHRGERFTRTIRPVRIWFGQTEWHPQRQWLLEAHDYSRDGLRNFALSEVHRWSAEAADDAS